MRIFTFYLSYLKMICGITTRRHLVWCTRVVKQSESKSHISLVCYLKEPHHTNEHTWTLPHLFLTRTHNFAQLDYCKYHTQHDNDRYLQAIDCYEHYLVVLLAFLVLNNPPQICKSHLDFQGEQLVQNFATYTQIHTVFR